MKKMMNVMLISRLLWKKGKLKNNYVGDPVEKKWKNPFYEKKGKFTPE